MARKVQDKRKTLKIARKNVKGQEIKRETIVFLNYPENLHAQIWIKAADT